MTQVAWPTDRLKYERTVRDKRDSRTAYHAGETCISEDNDGLD